jgi:hypothetical protein
MNYKRPIRPLWGAEAIAKKAGLKLRKTFYLLEKAYFPPVRSGAFGSPPRAKSMISCLVARLFMSRAPASTNLRRHSCRRKRGQALATLAP